MSSTRSSGRRIPASAMRKYSATVNLRGWAAVLTRPLSISLHRTGRGIGLEVGRHRSDRHLAAHAHRHVARVVREPDLEARAFLLDEEPRPLHEPRLHD